MKKITNFKLRVTSYKLQVLLAAFVLSAFCFLPFSVFAQDCDDYGTTGPLEWCLKDGTLTISGEGEMPDYVADGQQGEMPPWSYYRESIYTIIIETGVQSIGKCAFHYTPNLPSITLPNSVSKVEPSAFYQCSNFISFNVASDHNALATENGVLFNKSKTTLICFPVGKTDNSYIIPGSVTSIGKCAFTRCLLTSITFPNNLTSIGRAAFQWCCYLTSVTLPNSVTNIDTMGFWGCIYLSSVTLSNSLTNIGRSAFADCDSLSSITLPNSLASIGDAAFGGCPLTTITIPENVTSIGIYAFGSKLETVNYNAINCSYNPYSPDNGNLYSMFSNGVAVSIGDKVQVIPRYAFSGCNISSTTLPNSLTSIGERAFRSCHTAPSITIPNGVTSIGEEAFLSCNNLTAINVENGNNAYSSDDGILYNKAKTTLIVCPAGKFGSYDIPNSVTHIEKRAFDYCTGLSSIILSNGITEIDTSTFETCYSLDSITIPSGVANIKARAFWHCSKLASISCYALTPPALYIANSPYDYDGTFEGVPITTCVLTVPTSAVSLYQEAAVWKDFIIEAGGMLVYPKPVDPEQGFVNGNGLYNGKSTATVEAIAHKGYRFVNWTKDGVVVSSNSSYSFTVTEDVELVAHFEEYVGIDELPITNYELRIYPNPTTGELRIEVADQARNDVINVEIFDIYGRQMSQISHHCGLDPQPKSHISNQIDIAHLPAGIYFVKIITEAGEVVRKVVKE